MVTIKEYSSLDERVEALIQASGFGCYGPMCNCPRIFVAWDGAAAVGYLAVEGLTLASADAIFVCPSYRRIGVGRALAIAAEHAIGSKLFAYDVCTTPEAQGFARKIFGFERSR